MKTFIVIFFLLTIVGFSQKRSFYYLHSDNGSSSTDLIITATLTNGYIGTSGTVISNDPHWRYTNEISVTAGKSIQIKMYGHPVINTYSFYTSSHTYISGAHVAASLDLFNSTVTVPANAVYVRFSFGEKVFVETAGKTYYLEAVMF